MTDKLKRYRLIAMEFIDRKGWEKLPNTGKYHIHAQKHKKGGWCNYSDVKAMEKILEKAASQCVEQALRYKELSDKYIELKESIK